MLPVSIITGFLGSGKTTLLNRLLQHDSLKNSLVIINEFGEVGIDHLLVSAPADNMRLLANGCLCCEVKGELVETLTEVSVKRANGEIPAYDRVLIETTGLADPVPIVQTIVTDTDLSKLYRLDTVIGVVDTLHAVSQLARQSEVVKQIAVSDIVLLSKTDLVDADALTEVRGAVRKINGGAEILKATHGDVHPDALFGRAAPDGAARVADLERWLAAESATERSKSKPNAYTLHAGDISTYTLFHDGPVTASGLATWLSMLASFRGPQLLRVKGLINVGGTPYIVHAVQTVIHEPVELEDWPSDDKRTRIVFIVRGVERAALERTFTAFSMPESLGADALQIDPAAYARFVEAAKQFI
jgi:G3E family GTPase